MASTDATIGIGTEFIGYRIEALLGQGGMGIVYRAFDLRLKRSVALKFVAPELAEDDGFRARFLTESELAASLEHPTVVPIHDAGEVGGHLYLAMRYVDGPDLRTVLRDEGALDPARALGLCRQVAASLDAAHARGLVHRDVKPSNVLLDAREHVYLTDFGLTRQLGEAMATGDGRSMGTPAYLAPEQIDGGAIDGRADVYALGCLLFECLTGGAPYAGNSRMEVAWAHLEEEPPRASERNPRLPAAIDPVLRRALAKRPEDRPSTCAELIAAAEDALGLGRGARSARVAVLAAAAVGVLAVAGSVLAAAIINRDDAAAPAPAVRVNSLVRIHPWKHVVTDVIPVGVEPTVAAVKGRSAWVYNYADRTILRVDTTTLKPARATRIRGRPVDLSFLSGPVLGADADRAWMVTADALGRGYLTRIPAAGVQREFRMPGAPKAVGLGEGAVWVLARRGASSQVLRIDPTTGRIVHTVSLGPRSRADSLLVGLGFVWAVSSTTAVVYRVDPRTRLVRSVDIGERAGRPSLGPVEVDLLPRTKGFRGTKLAVNVTVSDFDGSEVVVDRTARQVTQFPGDPIGQGFGVLLGGWPWGFDPATGMVIHFRRAAGNWFAKVRVTDAPYWGGLCMTSLAAGAGAIWVTVGPNSWVSNSLNVSTAANCPTYS
ncbi:MAG: protein kinase domain-containing protein [Gaiellaceae bacterium]